MSSSASAIALDDAGCTSANVDAIYFANAAQGYLDGQEMIRGQVALQDSGMLGTPIINVENACASGTTAVHLAWNSVASGQSDIALVVGAEKLSHPDKYRSMAAIGTAIDRTRVEPIARQLDIDAAEFGANHSLFMDIYAAKAQEYMAQSGATEHDFAAVVSKNRRHAAHNELAQFRHRLSADDVRYSRLVSSPLTLFMCAPMGDGAASLVLCSREAADRNGIIPVEIIGTSLVSGQIDQPSSSAEERAARSAYEQAGISPDDVDVIELHDAAAPAELAILEEIGVCARGDAPKLLAAGDTQIGGRIPVNTSGGLIARGHPIGATGCAQLVELVTQLRGRAGKRQVTGARTALAQNAGGHLGPDPAVACVTILQRR